MHQLEQQVIRGHYVKQVPEMIGTLIILNVSNLSKDAETTGNKDENYSIVILLIAILWIDTKTLDHLLFFSEKSC